MKGRIKGRYRLGSRWPPKAMRPARSKDGLAVSGSTGRRHRATIRRPAPWKACGASRSRKLLQHSPQSKNLSAPVLRAAAWVLSDTLAIRPLPASPSTFLASFSFYCSSSRRHQNIATHKASHPQGRSEAKQAALRSLDRLSMLIGCSSQGRPKNKKSVRPLAHSASAQKAAALFAQLRLSFDFSLAHKLPMFLCS